MVQQLGLILHDHRGNRLHRLLRGGGQQLFRPLAGIAEHSAEGAAEPVQ